MSWNDYVNGYLINYTDAEGRTNKNICEKAALIGNSDGTIWASTDGFTLANYNVDIEDDAGDKKNIQVNEFANLLDAFSNGGKTTKAGGVRISREKYLVVGFDPDKSVMYLKKGNGGACVAKSNVAFVIGTFNAAHSVTTHNGDTEPQSFGTLNKSCESLQQFLCDNNL